MTSVWSSSQFSVWFWPNLCLLGVLGAGQSWAWVQTGRWLAFKVSCHQCFPHPGRQGHNNCNIFSTTTNLDHVTRHASADQDRATLIAQLINKHQEQKEAFLKVIIIILITIINIIWCGTEWLLKQGQHQSTDYSRRAHWPGERRRRSSNTQTGVSNTSPTPMSPPSEGQRLKWKVSYSVHLWTSKPALKWIRLTKILVFSNLGEAADPGEQGAWVLDQQEEEARPEPAVSDLHRWHHRQPHRSHCNHRCHHCNPHHPQICPVREVSKAVTGVDQGGGRYLPQHPHTGGHHPHLCWDDQGACRVSCCFFSFHVDILFMLIYMLMLNI